MATPVPANVPLGAWDIKISPPSSPATFPSPTANLGVNAVDPSNLKFALEPNVPLSLN